MFGPSWKTTLGGIAAIFTSIGAAANAFRTGDMTAVFDSIPAIMAGIGLLMAKDSNVTGGTVSSATGVVLPHSVSVVDQLRLRPRD